MPTPSPNSDASEVRNRPHADVAATPDVSPASRPPSTAPAKPAIIPAMPITSPNHEATTTFAVTTTHRAGWAVTAAASVPCCTSDVNISVPVMEASTVVSHVEKMNV